MIQTSPLMAERGKVHLNANDKQSHYRNRKLYNVENLHHNKQINIFDYKYGHSNQQKNDANKTFRFNNATTEIQREEQTPGFILSPFKKKSGALYNPNYHDPRAIPNNQMYKPAGVQTSFGLHNYSQVLDQQMALKQQSAGQLNQSVPRYNSQTSIEKLPEYDQQLISKPTLRRGISQIGNYGKCLMDNSGLKGLEHKRQSNNYKTPNNESNIKIMPDYYGNNQDIRGSQKIDDQPRQGYGRHEYNPTSLKNIAYQRQLLTRRQSQYKQVSRQNTQMQVMTDLVAENYSGYNNSRPEVVRNGVDAYSRSPELLPQNLLTEDSEEYSHDTSGAKKYKSNYMQNRPSRNDHNQYEQVYRPLNYNTIDISRNRDLGNYGQQYDQNQQH